MIPLSPALTAQQRARYDDVIASSGDARWTYQVLNLSGRLLGAIDAPEDGQISVTRDGDVTRTWTGTMIADGTDVTIDTDRPQAGSLYFTKLLRVRHTVHVPTVGDVSCTPMVGWITKYDPDGDVVDVEAQGLEALGRRSCTPLTIPKGTRVVTAIRTILQHGMGQTEFRFPTAESVPDRLDEPVEIGWAEELWPWPTARRLAAAADRQLVMSGDGYAVLRRLPTEPTAAFSWPGNVTSRPKASFSIADLRNRIMVDGKAKAFGSASLAAVNPLSALHPDMQRNGVPLWFAERVDNDKIGTSRAADRVAASTLAARSTQALSVAYEAVPKVDLDAGDLATLTTPTYELEHRLDEFAIPTGGSGDMTVGFRQLIRRPTVTTTTRRR